MNVGFITGIWQRRASLSPQRWAGGGVLLEALGWSRGVGVSGRAPSLPHS